MKLHQEVFNSIYEKYEGHTWYVQCLLNRLYGYDRNVDMELVAYVTGQILSEYSYMYADLLKTYSFGQVRLLKAIAREGCVKEVLAANNQQPTIYYDLQGRRVANPTKGIFITNHGEKVLK